MEGDQFIQIDDIKGESIDSAHKDEIEVLSWRWILSQPASSHRGTGSGSGKVRVRDLSFNKYTDRSTPRLVKMCCTGAHFKLAQLTLRKAGGSDPVEYLRLKLNDGMITGVHIGGMSHQERMMERVTLQFASFTYEYTPQLSSGLAAPTIPMMWNIAANTER